MISTRRERSFRLWAIAGFLVLAVCAGVAGVGAGRAATTPLAGAVSASHLPCDAITSFAGAGFSNPAVVTNQFYPLAPGTKLVFEGMSEGTPHKVVFIVTDLTKTIGGVRSRIFWERDFSDGELVETELAFRAQDNAGNVWHMGEYPEVYEDGVFVEALPWIAGLEDAEPGTMMTANPRRSTPIYLQGFAPEVDFLDCAKVHRTGRDVCVPAGCFHNVLAINETSPNDPAGGTQRKFYAPGVGNIRVMDPDDPSGEFLDLTRIEMLDEDDLEDARDHALRLERHAYQISDVYGETPPSEVWPPSGGGGGGGGGSTQTFTASRDTFVRSNYPNENNGALATVRAYKSGPNETHSYLLFTVSGVSGSVSSAKLRLFVKDASAAGGALHRVADNGWSESTMTWNTRSPLGSFIANVGAAPLNTWVELDVTSYLTGNGTFSFGLTGVSSDTTWYSSREGTNPPQLVVTGT